jgi:hypothetical protein
LISQPTTDQILLDCRRELLETVLPALSDPAVVVCVQMLENVLRNTAARAAHEIAWMTEECERILDYAGDVAAALPDSDGVIAAIDAAEKARNGSLHLSDVVGAYSSAGEALSCAIETAVAAGDGGLTERGVELIRARTEREQEIKGEWSMIGRG